MSKILVTYATKFGATKEVAELIANEIGADVKDAKELNEQDLSLYEGFVFAASTHGDGRICENFEGKLDMIASSDMNGRKVALVGVGNVERHGDDFCSGMSEFLPVLKKANLIGAMGAEGYEFRHSRAFINGKFVGLTIDYKGDPEWKKRAQKWSKTLNF